MKLDQQSHIIARKSNLHVKGLHIDCELWGWTDKMDVSKPARLLNFYRKNSDAFGIAPNNEGASELAENVPVEEFSAQLWQVPIQEDWEKLDKVTEIRIYASIIERGKMFFTLDLQRP